MARARTVFPRDSGLQFRMLLTLFLLGLLYAVFVAVLLAAGAGVGVMVVVIVGLALARLFLCAKPGRAATGLMKTPEPHELEAVLAHELTHVKNRDVLIMTVASFFATIASMIAQLGFWFGGWGGSDDDGAPAFIVILLVSFVVYIVSFFLMLALSRYRQYAAAL